ncbi:MAG: DUF192 domain-containing protein [Bacteroidetes bacterium]|nr:DUF192 domain-containing protein [Bacteroidota bacterium]
MIRNTSGAGAKKKLSPLVIIGGSVILLAVAFFFISRSMLDQRDPEVSRVLSEQSRKQRSGEASGDEQQGAVQMREDAALTFVTPDGAVRTIINIEIADEEASRTQGLMGRQHMAEDQGMLFVFPDEDYRSFWMANTPLPLDIIYVNKSNTIVTIQRNTVPYSEESVPSTAPATYVIEVNAGFSDRHGIMEGDKVRWQRK